MAEQTTQPTLNDQRYQFLRDRFALESSNDEADFAALAHLNGDEFDAALDAAMLKAGFEIAQEVEPVGHVGALHGCVSIEWVGKCPRIGTPLYTAPQAVNADLREALKEFIDAFDGVIAQGGSSVTIDDQSSGWVSRARAAIAKAVKP